MDNLCQRCFGELEDGRYFNQDRICCIPCRRIDALEEFEKTKYLYPSLMNDLYMRRHHSENPHHKANLRDSIRPYYDRPLSDLEIKTLEDLDHLEALASQFAQVVWTPKFRRLTEKSKKSMFSGTVGNIQVMSYMGLGRIMITIEDKTTGMSVTYIGVEGKDYNGLWLRSVSGETPKVIELAKKINAQGHLLKMSPDPTIGFG